MTKRAVKNPGPPQRPAHSEIFAALELLQNCTLFEEEQVASHLRTYLEKFSMLYEKTLESRKQQSKIEKKSRDYRLIKMGHFF